MVALEAGDPLLAEAAKRMHLKASMERWFDAGSGLTAGQGSDQLPRSG